MDQFNFLKQGQWQKTLNKGKEWTILIPTQTQQGDSNPNTTLGGTKRIESGSPSKQRKSQKIRKVKDFGPDFISYQA